MDKSSKEMLVHGAREMGVELGPEEMERFDSYIGLLQLWGKKMNLTSRLESGEIVVYHFLDSLAAISFFGKREEGRLVDIGAGAGFPSLPLKICLPRIEATLIDSSHKRVSFCLEVVRRLYLNGVKVLQGRGEELGEDSRFRAQYDWAVTRALGSAAKTARICLPFLHAGGTLLLFKGKIGKEELRSLDEETARWGASVHLREVRVPYLKGSRSFVLVRKCST